MSARQDGVIAAECSVTTGILTLTVQPESNMDSLTSKVLDIVKDMEYGITVDEASLTAAKSHCTPAAAAPASSSQWHAVLVGGMSCQKGCADSIQREVSQLAHVEEVVCTFADNTLRVRLMDPSSLQAVKNKVMELGYEVIEPGATSSDTKPSVDKKKAVRSEEIAIEMNRRPSEDAATFHSTFDVKGMTCASCAAAISRSVKSLPGIARVDVAVLLDKAVVFHDPAKSSRDSIQQAIVAAGYKATFVSDSNLEKDRSDGMLPTVYKYGVTGFSCRRCPEQVAAALYAVDADHVSQVDIVDANGIDWMTKDKLAFAVDEAWTVTVTLVASTTSPSNRMCGPRMLLKAIQSMGMSARFLSNDENARIREALMRTEEIKAWRTKFVWSLGFTIPVLIMAMGLVWIPAIQMSRGAMIGLAVAQFVLTSYVQFVSGAVFHAHALKALRARSATMDVLISLGTFAAYLYSTFSLVYVIADPDYMGEFLFETAAALITFMLLGKYLENVAKGKSSEAMVKLLDLKPSTAWLVTGADRTMDVEEIDSSLIEEGDILRVKAGDKMPCDGEVDSGSAIVDESMLTGESMPVRKQRDMSVIGGTIVREGILYVAASRLGEDSTLAQMLKLMEQAQSSKAPSQRLADSVSAVFVPLIVLLAVVVFFIWLGVTLSGNVDTHPLHPVVFSLIIAIAVIVVACPCALGLATPTAVLVGSGVGATHGILIKSGEVLELASQARILCFDKTGTLTIGQPRVEKYAAYQSANDETSLKMVRVLESQSEHPIAAAIVKFIDETSPASGEAAPSAQSFETLPGQGVSGTFTVEGTDKVFHVLVGTQSFLSQTKKVAFSEECKRDIESFANSGLSIVLVAVNDRVVALFGLGDAIRPDAASTVKALHSMGMHVYMVSGDHVPAAQRVGRAVGIPESRIVAGVLPSGKIATIQTLQQHGRLDHEDAATPDVKQAEEGRYRVIHVGDGLNDAPALMQADVGMAVAAGTDVALESAGIVLMKDNIWDVVVALDLARTTVRRIWINYGWALGYNVVAIPIAAGVLFPVVHYMVPPIAAGAAMVLSSLSVLGSSLLLKKYRAPSEPKSQPEIQVTDC
jgi:Cu+-exporting ATPase